MDSGCTLGSFALNNNNNNNNSNANNNNNNNNSNSNNNNNNSNNNGSLTLSSVTNISSSHNSSRSASIRDLNVRVDDLGTLHVAYEEADIAGQDLQVKYSTLPSGGSWSTPATLSAGTSGLAVQAGTLRMDLSASNGTVHVVWQQGVGTAGRVFATHDRSGDFVTAFAVSTAAGEPASQPGLRVDAAGTAHYAWTRLVTPRRIVYRGLFNGTLSSGEQDVSGRSTHGGDDAFLDPEGLVLIAPDTSDQAFGVFYLAVVTGQQRVLYTERAAGSSGLFGDISDVSLQTGSTHPSGTVDSVPRTVRNARGDLGLLWASQRADGVRDTRANGRVLSGSFQALSVNLTSASAGDSSRATAPVDVAGRGILDTSGLHFLWEDAPGGATSFFRHRYIAPVGSDPTGSSVTAFGDTSAFAGLHTLMAGLDQGENLLIAWEEEDANGLRDILVRRRGAGTAGGFDTTNQLITTTEDSRLRGLGVSSAGRALVAYEEGSIPAVFAAVRETDGSASGPVNVSRQTSLASVGVTLKIDPVGTGHVFWLTTFNGSQRDLMHATVR